MRQFPSARSTPFHVVPTKKPEDPAQTSVGSLMLSKSRLHDLSPPGVRPAEPKAPPQAAGLVGLVLLGASAGTLVLLRLPGTPGRTHLLTMLRGACRRRAHPGQPSQNSDPQVLVRGRAPVERKTASCKSTTALPAGEAALETHLRQDEPGGAGRRKRKLLLATPSGAGDALQAALGTATVPARRPHGF